MTGRRYYKAILMGTLILTASLLAAYSAERNVTGATASPEAASLDAAAGTTAAPAGVSWDLPVTRNDRVENWISFLAGRNRDKTELWMERSGRYTPLIKAELRRRGMPEDLIYLAFIESGFSPNAKSHASAVGIWQFISETGQRYGLEVTTYVDERRDPFKATGAALTYLQELYGRFGSWYLAAAAYNTGENRVARIMRETTGKEHGTDADYWRIASLLPRETRNYVPLMLAAGHIGKEPAKYGFDDVEYQQPMSFTTVNVPKSVPLTAVAKATGVDTKVIEDLNPELVRDQTPPTRDWDVRVPVGTSELFATNFPSALQAVRLASATAKQANPSTAKKKSSQVRYHSVRPGESLWTIARRHDMSLNSLKRLNGLRSGLIRPGQKLRVS